MTDDINVTFIIPKHCVSENDCSEEMKVAFTACEQHSSGGLKAEWIHEKNYNKFEGLTKRDVIVLSEFEGEIFKKLKVTKCLLVGPQCLSCSLIEGTPIPKGPEPVFTIAMRGLVVTASGFTKTKKENIKQRVHWMGGLYSSVLTEETTHLVSETVVSEKYIKSVEKNIPVMHESWVEAVWEASLQSNVNGSSSDFNGHRLPPFANLQVTTSGITKKEKLLIMKLVNENGGSFSGAFQSETTDVVVLTKDGVGSEKYKAALEYGKACVLPSWVKDSVSKGVALPFANYRVAGASTSSPLAEHRLPDMSLNFSRITNVTNARAPSNFVDESRSVDMTTLSGKMKLSQESKRSNETSSIDKEILKEFEKFDMSCIRKAGPIFDGFCIWVTGLEGTCRDRAAACVSRCGGVRYDGANERVTHAVAGTTAAGAAAARLLPAVPVLNAIWLLRSAEAGRALPEMEFLMDTTPSTPVKARTRTPNVEAASPMSKRNLQLLRHAPLNLPPPTPEPDPPEPHDDLVHHYLSQNVPEPVKEKTPEPVAPNSTMAPVAPDITEDMEEEPTEEIEQIFRGIKIEVQGLDEEAICEFGAEVAAAGGVLVAAGAGGSYTLVPLDFDPEELATQTAEPVTVFWVNDCLSQQELVPVQYYHRPVRVPQWSGPGPLSGVVACLSTYSGVERAFLDELAKLLGATTQLRFCRRTTPNALASTHLICPHPSGDKYAGAVKWQLPAVRASWLLACAEAGRRVSEKDHLVGDTKAPPTPEQSKEEVDAEETIRGHVTIRRDKENTMLPPQGRDILRRASFSNKDDTPKARPNDGDDMSPASRYIAMARQGLLGGDSQETPKRLQELKDDVRSGDDQFRTPPLDDALSSPNLAVLSPTTRRRLRAVRCGEMPSDPIRTPIDPFEKNPDTPDSAFGAALRPGSGRLSPESRKRLWKVVNDLPAKEMQSVREHHTPLSEIRNRFLAQFNSDAATPPSEHTVAPRKLNLHEQLDTPPSKMAKLSLDQTAGGMSAADEYQGDTAATSASSVSSASKTLPPAVDAQLQRLSAALTGRLSTPRARRTRDSLSIPPQSGPDPDPEPMSQPNTVGWDDNVTQQSPVKSPQQPPEPIPPPPKRFMLSSNVDNREEIASIIMQLGGQVCEGTELDASATHLLCAAPGRSEKMLGSVAGGRWVLHPAYVARSRTAGRFLDEEDFEWGNPRATCLPQLSGAEVMLARAAYRWRYARARGEPGPFAGVVALLHIPPTRRRLLTRLVVAGNGEAPPDEPPYTNEDITVCFADIKRYPLSERDAAWLVSRRIPVCQPVLLSCYLTDETPPDPVQHCLPEFRPK
ncbi:DNA topoisomerase 2-binding protein 1 [Battus philenor]|uniref:DNA topoisomerase 2-binding protein 1 n=1 Tax=Battus philenor TaxID=42288 RepID=UPI0035CF5238